MSNNEGYGQTVRYFPYFFWIFVETGLKKLTSLVGFEQEPIFLFNELNHLHHFIPGCLPIDFHSWNINFPSTVITIWATWARTMNKLLIENNENRQVHWNSTRSWNIHVLDEKEESKYFSCSWKREWAFMYNNVNSENLELSSNVMF